MKYFAKGKHQMIKMLTILVTALLSNSLNSQVALPCSYYNSLRTSVGVSYNSACDDYLKAFIPDTSDPTLIVEVIVWLFKNNDGSGFWHGDSTDAITMINDVNTVYNNLSPAHLAIPGVANLAQTKINFHLKNFFEIHDSLAYKYINYREQNFYDSSAINFYFCTNAVSGAEYPLPNDKIQFNTDTIRSICCTWDDGEAHEFAHSLGVDHTQYFPSTSSVPYNGNSFVNTGESCCPVLIANDVVLEGDSIWEKWGDCGDTTVSNNLTGYNAKCRTYLSPLQMALMHYNLRTVFKNKLTASSYNNSLSRNPNLDFNFQPAGSSEIWTINRYFKGYLTIKSGKKLEIQCKVGMAKGTYIIVENGAQLIISGGGDVTNISGQLWGGILVEGTSTLGQMVHNTTGFAANHGVARIINGGKVSQAENGVKNYITDSIGNIIWSSRGGVIIGDGGIFENNIRDVEFLSYQSPLGNDRSMFTNCIFRTDSNFNSTGPPYAHVSMWNTKGIQFKGCTFENLAGDKFGFDHGKGIHSIDAIYTVDKNGTVPSKFNNLSWGVLVGNTNPLKVVNIQNSEFTNCEVDAVNLKNMNNAIFNNNIVTIPYYYASTGLYLNTCKNYQVKNNSFEETPTQQFKYNVGIYAFNSQAGSHQIYNNLFSNLEQGISAMANNSGVQNTTDGLKMNCNDFVSGSSNKYDIAMLNYLNEFSGSVSSTVMRIQGANSNPDAYKLVRNKYGASTACSDCENKWYIQGTSAKQVIHGSNHINDALMHPTPQPQYSDTMVKDVPSLISYLPQHCPVNPGANGGVNPASAKLAALNDYLSHLDEYNDTENSLLFDIQATLSEKLNYFAADTLVESADSIIALIANNASRLVDSDLLLIYAYMNKGNYTEAENLVDALDSSRTEWKALLLKLIEVYTDEEGIFSLADNTTNLAFFNAYAANDTIDGQAAAQSLLTFALHTEFSEPRLHPVSQGEGERRNSVMKDPLVILNNPSLKIYPNPSRNGIFLDYSSEKNSVLTIEIKDLTGRVIFTKFVKGSGTDYLALNELSNGIYLLSVTNEKMELLFQSKLIKQE